MSSSFIGGFIFDNFTLTRIDLLFDNLILFSYLAVATLGILFINIVESHKETFARFEKVTLWFPVITQFAFGGLLSGFLIFYIRSGSLLASWPFLVILAFLFLGNERFRRRYLNVVFQVSILFFALFSYAIFVVPIIIGEMGIHVFLLSGVISLVAINAFILLLKVIAPQTLKQSRKLIITSIIGVYVFINGLYFTGSIPPIPLSLKDSGVYHFVTRETDGSYVATREAPPWYQLYKNSDPTFRKMSGEAVYYYSAIFAPTDLGTTIAHRWQFFDDQKGGWVETDLLLYPITGGRDGGFRGYSIKRNLSPGKWRVDIITEERLLIGRDEFVLESVSTNIELEKVVLR